MSPVKAFSEFLRIGPHYLNWLKWKLANRHNMTSPVNVFDHKKVSVGKSSYGGIKVYLFGAADERVDIGNYVSIGPEVVFLPGGEHRLDAVSTYPFLAYGFGEVEARGRGPIVVKDGKVRIVTEVTGSKSAGFTHEAEWSFAADGSVAVANTVTPHGTMPMALPRLGLSLRLDGALERMRWYGRGPYENYVDRCTGSFLGVYDSTVTDQFVDYARPQDNGYKGDVRWVEFADRNGRGVRFSASEPMFVQALHYTAEDLEFARHRAGQQRFRTPLVPRREVCLNLDVRQLGLGGCSCGPRPMDKYIFPIERTSWTLRIEPVR